MTPTVLASRATRGVRVYRQGSRRLRGVSSPYWGLDRDASTSGSAKYVPREEDLNYYYLQVEMLWLAGLATTVEQIRHHLPPTERAHLADGLAALVTRNWLKVQDIPASSRDEQAAYDNCYVPVRTTGGSTTTEGHATR
ncbi:MAG: hypothetical protein ABI658_11730 [Acidimicrobiales bacterium]